MDVIAMHQAGFTNAVASLGTAFTAQQALLLKRYTKQAILTYDSDGAGIKAALRAIPILKDGEISVKVLDMQPYKDPDEFIKALGTEAFQERIEKAQSSFLFEIEVLERNFNLKDPAGKTKFHREIAKKLCGFSEEAERANYMEAIAEKYHIGHENLRKLVSAEAARTGLVRPVERPKSGIQSKKMPEDNGKKLQRLLITWLVERPEIYPKIKKYIATEDFTEELYREVARKLFEELEEGKADPAGLVDLFPEADKQNEVAKLFHTSIGKLENKSDAERALHDIVCGVKRNSYEYYSQRSGTDISALNQVIAGKKVLEELNKMHISLD